MDCAGKGPLLSPWDSLWEIQEIPANPCPWNTLESLCHPFSSRQDPQGLTAPVCMNTAPEKEIWEQKRARFTQLIKVIPQPQKEP